MNIFRWYYFEDLISSIEFKFILLVDRFVFNVKCIYNVIFYINFGNCFSLC